ncbi:MAG: MBL fold metallo-hydrolase [Actinomycetota bacterium]
MTLKSIATNVHHVGGVGAGVFLIVGDDITIVDTGIPGRSDRILAALREIGRDPSDVGRILITHYHNDHIGNLGPLAEMTEAQVFVPSKEAGVIRDGGKPAPMTPRGLLGAAFIRTVKLNELPPHPVHHEVAGGDELDVAGGMKVVDTPGHTIGHVAYLLVDPGVLFVGDAAANLLRLDVMPVNEDPSTAEKSFRIMAELDFEAAAIAHGRQITSDAAARFRKTARRFS